MNECQFERRRVAQAYHQEIQSDTTLISTRCVRVSEMLPDPFASTIFEMMGRHVFVDALKQTHCHADIQQARTHFAEEGLKGWLVVSGHSWMCIKLDLRESLPVKWGRPGRPRARAGLSRQNNGMFTIVCSHCQNETFSHRNIWWRPPTVTSKTD